MSHSTYSLRSGKLLVWLKGEVKTPPFSTAAREDHSIHAGLGHRDLPAATGAVQIDPLTRIDQMRDAE